MRKLIEHKGVQSMKVDKKKSAKIIKNTAMVMSVAFAGLYFISKKKKDSNKCTQLLEYKYFSKNN